MNDTQPREWWINGGWARSENNFGHYDKGEIIHVIEYSAYDALRAERDALKAELEERRIATPTMNASHMLQAENERLRVALEVAVTALKGYQYNESLQPDTEHVKNIIYLPADEALGKIEIIWAGSAHAKR